MKANRREFLKTAGLGLGAMSMGTDRLARAGEPDAAVALRSPTGQTISKVEWFKFSTPRPVPWNKDNIGKWSALRLTTDKDAQGWALMEGFRKPITEDFQKRVERAVVGQDPGDPEELLQRMIQQKIPCWEYCTIDTAVWDLLGRIRDKPVHEMLTGKTERERIGCYFSAGCSLGNELWLKTIRTCMAKGCPGYKVHPWVYIQEGLLPDGRNKGHKNPSMHPGADIEIYHLLRKEAGPDYPLMTDNFHTYTFEEAVEVGKVVDDLGYFWYESPMPEEDAWMDRHVQLRKRVKTPICAPEHGKTPPGETPWERRIRWNECGTVDINRMDFWHGGITGILHLARDCHRRGLRLELHNYSNKPAQLYYRHIWAAFPEQTTGWCELFTYPVEPMVPPGFKTTPDLTFRNGYIDVPKGPGTGIDMDWGYVERHNASES
jgi:L-alanine-DL-glutamate epimerase-like enolase superfamily enzyme